MKKKIKKNKIYTYLGHFAAASGMFEVLEWIAQFDKEALAAVNDNNQV